MALIDERRDVLVVRIVYDGAPYSGKTTTLRTLSGGLSRQLESPQEHEGRTVFFDWLDYTAGRFEGRAVRCQVVSVPGQRVFAQRRRWLLQEADAVVFVADTSAEGVDQSLSYAADLRELLKGMPAPRPGVVAQANKRDVSGALPLAEMAGRLRAAGLDAALVESVASSGTGVREAFLFGVRLALDRVKALAAAGALHRGRPETDSAADLLAQLTAPESADAAPAGGIPGTDSQGSEAEPPPDLVQQAIEAAIATEQPAVALAGASTAQPLPSPLVPAGCIWPSVEGRVMVQQAVSVPGFSCMRHPTGDLYAQSPAGWRLHSREADAFADHGEARAALLQWARCHVRNQAVISDRRCLLVSPDGDRWRLWQVVGVHGSLADALHPQLSEQPAVAVAALLATARALIGAAGSFRKATVDLPVGLTTVGLHSGEPWFIGLMPGHDRELAADAPRPAVDAAALVSQRMQRLLSGYAQRVGPERLIAGLEAAAVRDGPLAGLLIAAARQAG